MNKLMKNLISVSSVAAFTIFALVSCSQVSNLSAQAVKKDAFLPDKPSAKTLTAARKVTKKDKHGMPTYKDSQRTRFVRATAYSCAENEDGGIYGQKNCLGGTLKYGKNVRSAAADWSVYPVGTKFRIKGLPHMYIVDDFGSALVGTNTVDIYHPTLKLMKKWGTRKVELTIVQWGDYDRTLKLLSKRTRYKHCRKMYTNLKTRMAKDKLAKVENLDPRAGR